jgi:hypothetical protein
MPARLLAARVACAALAALAAGTTAHAQQPPATDWRAELLRVARAATFGAERAPVPDRSVTAGASTTGIPHVTFAAATGRRGDVGVAGRITARAAYPRLGIPAGVSYLWVVTREPVRMAIVPADPARPAYWLPTRAHATFTTTGSGTSAGSSSGTGASGSGPDAPCRGYLFNTQLGTRLPSGSTRLMLGACTCVNGRWMHTEGYGDMLTAANARVLLAR